MMDTSAAVLPLHHGLREAVQNSAEGGATEFRIAPDLYRAAVDPKAPIRVALEDNGRGMNLHYVRKLFGSDGRTQGLLDNFGVGLKFALLGHNPEGIMVATWGEWATSYGFPQGAVTFVKRFPNGDFWAANLPYTDPEGVDMVQPVGPVDQICPEYLVDPWGEPREHGVVIVLYGRAPGESTWDTYYPLVHKPAAWLNGRYFRMPKIVGPAPACAEGQKPPRRIQVRSWEYGAERPRQWKGIFSGKERVKAASKKSTSPNAQFREVKGRLRVLADSPHVQHATTDLGGGLVGHYFLVSKNAPKMWFSRDLTGAGREFMVVWKDEQYDSSESRGRLASCGVYNPSVQVRTTIAVELPDDYPGLAPNTERTLLFLQEGKPLPVWEWTDKLSKALPSFIREALDEDYAAHDFDALGEQVLEELKPHFPKFFTKRALERKPRKKGPKEPAHSRGDGSGTPHRDAGKDRPPSTSRFQTPLALWHEKKDGSEDDFEGLPDVPVPVTGNVLHFLQGHRIIRQYFETWEGRCDEDWPDSQKRMVTAAVTVSVLKAVLGSYMGAIDQRRFGWSKIAESMKNHCSSVLLNRPLVDGLIEAALLRSGGIFNKKKLGLR